MSIFQFLRIFWARWFIIVIAVVSAAVGSWVVTKLVRPRYEAEARALLNFSKPDPITGTSVTGGSVSAYLDAQNALIKGDRVGAYVADKLSWASDPGLVSEYQARPPSDTRDFRRWLAQRANDRTNLDVDGSILSIQFEAPSAIEAKVGAEELRRAYLIESLIDRQDYARRFAEKFAARAETMKQATEAAEIEKASYERATGIVGDGQGDVDSTRLTQLAGQVGAVQDAAAMGAPAQSPAAYALSEIDSAIAQASQTMGPQHPRMLALQQRRAQLVQIAQQQQSGELINPAKAAVMRAYDQQRSKVLGQRDKVERLRQLQTQVDLKREEYRRTAQRAEQLQLEASMADTGSTALGPVLVPRNPTFPNKALMVGGATALGLGLGFSLALLLELLNRRVRGVEDLDLEAGIHCIGVVAEPHAAGVSLPHRIARKLLGRSPLGMPA